MRIPATKASVGNREAELERRIAVMERAMRSVKTAQQDPTRGVLSQSAHGFAIGSVVRHNGTSWIKSQADAAANAIVFGVVSAVPSPDIFVLATCGFIAGLSSLTSGSVHYLSASSAGAVTTTTTNAKPIIPVLFAYSTTEAIMLPVSLPWREDDVCASGVAKKAMYVGGANY